MIILGTVFIITFDTSSSTYLLTSKTSLFKPLLVDVFDTFDIDKPIFLLEIALRNPYCANVMNPYIVAYWLIVRI